MGSHVLMARVNYAPALVISTQSHNTLTLEALSSTPNRSQITSYSVQWYWCHVRFKQHDNKEAKEGSTIK